MKGGDRKSKSAEQLKASGTYRPDRHDSRVENLVEPLDKIPPCPAYYDNRHKDKWDEVCGYLKDFGILAKQDLSAIRQYVETELMLFDSLKELREQGFTVTVEIKGALVTKVNPLLKVYTDCDKTIKPLREQFGFTPKARQSMHTKPAEKKKTDPILALLTPSKVKTG